MRAEIDIDGFIEVNTTADQIIVTIDGRQWRSFEAPGGYDLAAYVEQINESPSQVSKIFRLFDLIEWQGVNTERWEDKAS